MEELIKKFREKLEADRRTLKWWHSEYLTTGKTKYKYNYFIRQINTPDCMRPALEKVILEYVE